MQISIKEANQIITSRGNPMLQVVTEDGSRLGCFLPDLFPLLTPGNIVEVETEQRGGYNPNIVGVKEDTRQAQVFSRPGDRSASIEAQTAAKNVTELICAGKIELTGLAGQLCMAWNITRLEEALPEAMVSMITERTKKPDKS
jgi:hypothetical protein